jgi:hypothetical protein
MDTCNVTGCAGAGRSVGTVAPEGVATVQAFLGRPVSIGEPLTLCSQHRRAFESEMGLTGRLDHAPNARPAGVRGWLDVPKGIFAAVVAVIMVPLAAYTSLPTWAYLSVGVVVIGLGTVVYSRWLNRHR